MKLKIKFEIVDLDAFDGFGRGVYIKPRGSNLGDWQVTSGLMFYPMAGWRS
jgi:hypothetical protein